MSLHYFFFHTFCNEREDKFMHERADSRNFDFSHALSSLKRETQAHWMVPKHLLLFPTRTVVELRCSEE